MRIAKHKSAYNSLIIGLEVWNENQPIENHELGIFWCGRISPWTPPSRSNEDSQTSAYNSLIIGPRSLEWKTNL